MPQSVIALDVGSTKVACAVGLPSESSGGCEVTGSSLVPYPRLPETWLSDPLLVGRTIEQALEGAGGLGSAGEAHVVCSHPALRSERTRITLTLADEPVGIRSRDLHRLTDAAVNRVVGLDEETLLVERLGCSGNGFDGVVDPRGLAATRLAGDFHVVAMPMSARRAIVQAVEAAGLELARLTFSLPALAAANGSVAEAPQRMVLVDLGGLTVDVGLFAEGRLVDSATLGWGGTTLALAIARSLRVTVDQATAFSVEGMTSARAEVRQCLETHLIQLRDAIQRLVADQPLPQRLVLGGRGSLIDGVAEWLERATGLPASLCRGAGVQRTGELSHQVGVSAAIGLLELVTRTPRRTFSASSHVLGRLIERTHAILTEYF